MTRKVHMKVLVVRSGVNGDIDTGMFHPAQDNNDRMKWLNGTILEPPPAKRLSRDFPTSNYPANGEKMVSFTSLTLLKTDFSPVISIDHLPYK